ncbi:MAG: hydrolase [Oscillospiraceae bacterium]|jgi:hypothetical protein
MSEYRDRYIGLLRGKVHRDGIDRLIEWMDRTDFFVAPASSRYHLACREGLVMHSLNVYDAMKARNDRDPQPENEESLTLVSLLHDLCKAEFYRESTRNRKNEKTGQWEKVPCYVIEDKFPYGHGEKSVYLIERFVRLKPQEAIAIRWHMGGFDDSARGGGSAVSQAFERYPLAVKLHLADIEATYLMEGGEDEGQD